MKKVFVIIMALSLVAAFSGPVIGAQVSNGYGMMTFGTSNTDPANPMVYGLSNNVYITYNVPTGQVDYALGAKHKAGNREYFTTNNTSNVYYIENDTYKGLVTISNTLPDPTSTDFAAGTAL